MVRNDDVTRIKLGNNIVQRRVVGLYTFGFDSESNIFSRGRMIFVLDGSCRTADLTCPSALVCIAA